VEEGDEEEEEEEEEEAEEEGDWPGLPDLEDMGSPDLDLWEDR